MYDKVAGIGKCNAGKIANANEKTDTARLCLEYCKRKPTAGFFSWDKDNTDCECYDGRQICNTNSNGNFKSYRIL